METVEKPKPSEAPNKHFRILKRKNFTKDPTNYAIIGYTHRVKGEKHPRYVILKNLGKIKYIQNEQMVLKQIEMWGPKVVELAKTYFKRKREKDLKSGKTIEQLQSDASGALEEAKKHLKELRKGENK